MVSEKSLIKNFNGNKYNKIKSESINKMISDIAKANYDKIAIEFGDEKISYQTLNQQIKKVGKLIKKNSPASQKKICILTSRGIKLIVLLLGILKTNNIFIPLNPKYPVKKIEEIIKNTEPDFFIIDNKFIKIIKRVLRNRKNEYSENYFADNNSEKFILKNNFTLISVAQKKRTDQPPENIHKRTAWDFIYLTSGSTDDPKFVYGAKKGLAYCINYIIKKFNIKKDWRIAQLPAVSFIAFLRDTLVPLCAGATLCIPAEEPASLGADGLANWIFKKNINFLTFPPTFLQIIADNKKRAKLLKKLKYIFVGGEEMLNGRYLKNLMAASPKINIINSFGYTEMGLARLYHRLTAEDLKNERIPIGRPMEGLKAIILNEQKKVITEPNIAGELYLRVLFSPSGLYHKDELTDENFLINPFSRRPRDIVFKTGDLVERKPDGNYVFYSRKVCLVNIGGIRIGLGEIEKKLLQHKSIISCAVIEKKDKKGRRALAAYFISSKPIPVSELRKFLAKSLPNHNIPNYFIRPNNLPRNFNNKIDRLALSKIKIPEKPTTRKNFPQKKFEKDLIKIWQKVLCRKEIGVNDDFFEIGGNSLKVIELHDEINKHYPEIIKVADLFIHKTVSELSNHITNKNKI